MCGPSQGRQQSDSSPSPRLPLFMSCSSVNIFPQAAGLLAKAAPAWIPHRVTSPGSRPSPSLSMAPQVLPRACSSATGSQLALGTHLLYVRSSKHCRHLLPHHGLHCGLQCDLSSGPWSTFSPSSTYLGVYRADTLTYSLSSLCLFLHRDYFCLGL